MANAYLIDVASILETLGGSIEIADDIELGRLQVGTECFEPVEDAHIDLTVSNTGGAVVAMGVASVTVEASCSRCLRPFHLVISGEVDGFYVHHGADGELPDEQEVEYIDAENRIDVLPAILSALVLSAPFAPIHDEDCAGICPHCGADRNEGPCGCNVGAEKPAGPFDALRDLLPPSGEGESQR